MVRIPVAVALVATLVPIPTMADASPLCRDTKGLFTPCVGISGSPRDRQAARPATRIADPRVTAIARSAPAKPHPVTRPLVSQTRLCRDTKGLFTPCPR